jgi:predicted Fe-Mo cluster-binding NifX family protein
MTRIGMPVSRTDLDAPPAEHFAKAKWLVVVEAPDRFEFIRNPALDGRTVAAELAAHGCTDVVSRRMGCGAYAHVTAAGMRAWEADANVTPRVVAERLANGALRPLAPDDCGHGRGHHHGHRSLH